MSQQQQSSEGQRTVRFVRGWVEDDGVEYDDAGESYVPEGAFHGGWYALLMMFNIAVITACGVAIGMAAVGAW